MNRQNSFLAHLILLQRSLVVKLGVSPSQSHLVTFAFIRGQYSKPQAAVLRRNLAPSQLTIYNQKALRNTYVQELRKPTKVPWMG
jgi:hypothetical protein